MLFIAHTTTKRSTTQKTTSTTHKTTSTTHKTTSTTHKTTTTTHKVTTTTTHSSSHSSTKHSSSKVAKPTHVDKAYLPCGAMNHRNNLFLLRTHVIWGNAEIFEDLYILDREHGESSTKRPMAPRRLASAADNSGAEAASSSPHLTRRRDEAGAFFFDASSVSVALWHGGCRFSGLTMNLDHDANAWSAVFLNDQVGTARMSIEWGHLDWDNDRFGSWLACKREGGHFELFWWDVIGNKGIDGERCAKVDLIVENL